MASCKPGYFGIFCNMSCPTGTYGPGCGGRCSPHCSDEICDPVQGCVKQTDIPIHTTSLETNKSMHEVQTTTVGYATNSTKNTEFVHETLEPKTIIEIQPVHVLLGIFVFIIMLLLIIVMKRRKKSISLKGRDEQGQSSHGNTAQSENSNMNDHRSYDTISEQFLNQPYQSLEVHYAEIDESSQWSNLNASNSLNSLTGGQTQDAANAIESLNKGQPDGRGYGGIKFLLKTFKRT